MRLQPVYLVAPEPQPPSMPTRRAWLLAGFAASAGAGLGFGAGWWGRRAPSARDSTSPEHEERFRWALQLATSGTATELLDELPAYVAIVHEAVSLGIDEPVLWSGVRAAAAALLADPGLPGRKTKARALLTLAALGRDPALDPLAPALLLAQR